VKTLEKTFLTTTIHFKMDAIWFFYGITTPSPPPPPPLRLLFPFALTKFFLF